MKPISRSLLLSLLAVFLITIPTMSQQEPDEPEDPVPAEGEQAEVEEEEADEGEGRRGRDEEEGIRDYAEVITDEAETQEGVFKVHRIDDEVFYEIPVSELDKEFLIVTRISRTALGSGFGGQKVGERVVRWVRNGDRVFLRNINYGIVADADLPVARAVADSNTEAIIAAFDIEALGDGEAPVIDVSSLYATEITEFSARSRLQARGFDRDRSYVDRVMAFPTNIEVRAIHTFTRPPDNDGGGRGGLGRGGGMPPGSASIEMAFSMVKLPEDPMMPRLFDDRVGYFSESYIDYGLDVHRSEEVRFITRWRLEKQDPEAEVSDPIKPIVYYVDPATPTQWVPWIVRGIEDWQPAFEEAGFSNAIIGMEAPDDPDWSPEDARYSVVRWLASQTENASGPHVHDPRTGEILESDIQFYHNVMNLLRDWYFVQVAPLDPDAQDLPLSDDLMGRMLEFVVAHEVGHTLGFQHNMKASSTYPFENLRDPEWLAEMGHTPTLMDYSRFNYVVQPEDNVPPELLIPTIGPYDKWATMWGYKPIPEATTPEEELPTLNQWALVQEDTPWLRFSTAGSGNSDPGNLTEAVGDINAVEATRLGVRNLERVVDLLLDATSEPGRNWDDLEEMYDRTLAQWVREMNHVAALVGAFDSQQRHDGQDGVRFWPVSADRQAEAVRFLNENAFRTPDFLIRPDILRRIEPSGVLDRVLSSQRSVMNTMLNADRFTRLVEQEAIDGNAYAPMAFLDDVRRGVWSELTADSVTVDAFRRNVQRLYLDLVNARLNGTADSGDDMRTYLRAQLNVLETEINAAVPRAGDQVTRYYLEDSQDRIGEILDPMPATTEAAMAFAESLADDPFNPYLDHGCWVDVLAWN